MGGGPTISGGMSQAEYQQLLAEQQKITSQQDAEAQIAAELEAAQQEDVANKGSMGKLGQSFYDSLFQGLYGTPQERPK